MTVEQNNLRPIRPTTGRYVLQSSGERWRVVELGDHPAKVPTPHGSWTDHAAAEALRERLFRGLTD